MKRAMAIRKIEAGITSYPITMLLKDKVGFNAKKVAIQKLNLAKLVLTISLTKNNDAKAYKADCKIAIMTSVFVRLMVPKTYISIGYPAGQ